MPSLGNLFVTIGAKTDDLEKGVDKSTKKLGNLRSTMVDIVKKSTLLAAGAAATGAAITTHITRAAAEGARELQNMANVANTNVVELQRMASASRTVGIEQDKLSDILKDVNDRVGDFIQTGGGPMADFFEQIAPKVGVTAQEFRNLSGPDALQLFYTSLEKANLSQEDMVFYMEAMASDLTMLQPLLKNNGELLNEIGDKAQKAGRIMSEIEVQQLVAANESFKELEQTITAVQNKIAIKAAPYLETLSDMLVEAANDGDKLNKGIEATINTIIKGFGFAADAVQGLRVAIKGVELIGKAAAGAMITSWEITATAISKVIDFILAGVNKAISALNELPRVDIKNIDPFSDSAFITGLKNLGDSAREEVVSVRSELASLAMQPMPSTQVEKFLADVAAKSQEAAKRVVESRNQIMNIVGPDAANDDGLDGKQRQELEALKEKYLTQEELEREHRETMAIIGEQFDATRFESESQWASIREQEMMSHWARMQDIANGGYKGIASLAHKQWGAVGAETAGAFQSIIGTVAQGSRKAFEISKAWGIADALISTYQGIAAGVKLGWPAAIPAVAWAAANGFAQVTAIKNQQFGGGGSSSAGAATSAPAAAAPSAGNAGGGNGQSDVGSVVTLSGLNPNQLYDGRQMISVLQEAIDNGAKLRIAS